MNVSTNKNTAPLTGRSRMRWLWRQLSADGINLRLLRPFGARLANFKMRRHPRGIVMASTGYGKSGIIITDIVHKVRAAKKHREKLFITISTPLLVLNDQIYQDFIEVLTVTCPWLNAGNCVFVDNSCDKAQQKGNVKGTNIPKWSLGELAEALTTNLTPDFVFVISTHKSYNGLLSGTTSILDTCKNAGFGITAYFDESHLIQNGSNQEENNQGTTNGNTPDEDEEVQKIYMDRLDTAADEIYFVTATPAKWAAEWFKGHPGAGSVIPNFDGFVARVPISQAIAEEAILPLQVNLVKVQNNSDIATLGETIKQILAMPKSYRYRKLLVTCTNSGELKQIEKELVENHGIAVASTCSKYGKTFRIPGGKYHKGPYTITQFSEIIKKYPNNMVILHIRQMTAGIDCSAITSVTNRVFDNTARNCVKMIQTNGRALRLAERGKSVAQMSKKFGEVFDIINSGEADAKFVEDAKFLCRFYNVIYGTTAVKVFRLNAAAKSVQIPQLTLDETLPPVGAAEDFSEPQFYGMEILASRRNEFQQGKLFPELQDGILQELLKEFDKLETVQLNNGGDEYDWSWYSADRSMSPNWDIQAMKYLNLFK